MMKDGSAQEQELRGILVKFTIGLAVGAVTLSPAGLRAGPPERQALWLAVQACVADHELTGAPFPCLKVDLKGGEARGYVVMRAPFDPDTILTPTRKVSGIEDPWLRSRAAPNYFADAWRYWTLLEGPDGRLPPREDFALAVNSKLSRSQDQFHIHLGCLAPSVKRWLPALAPSLPVGGWMRMGAFWMLRTGQEDPTEVRPLRIAAEAMGGRVNFARMTILVAKARIDRSEEMLIVVSESDSVSAENLLDSACIGETRASAAR